LPPAVVTLVNLSPNQFWIGKGFLCFACRSAFQAAQNSKNLKKQKSNLVVTNKYGLRSFYDVILFIFGECIKIKWFLLAIESV
jgi:hypothetical protein